MTSTAPTPTARTALVTGASKGLGLALADALADDGWQLVITARHRPALAAAQAQLVGRTPTRMVVGDVADPAHRRTVAAEVARLGGLDLLVNNASDLGPSPLPALADIDPERLLALYDTNVVAPVALLQATRELLRPGAVVVNVTSDAASGPWPGWGPYGSAKAALDQVSNVLAVEHPDLHIYAVDPGDMRTDMHQAAFPGEDISDRPLPATVVPALRHLLATRPPSGHVRAAELQAEVIA